MPKIKNMSSCTVVIVVPMSSGFFRKELTPGREVKVSDEVVAEMEFDPGVDEMLKMGVIALVDDTETVSLSDKLKKSEDGVVLSRSETDLLMKDGKIADLLSALKAASNLTKENIVESACKLQAIDKGRRDLIEKYCGVDLLSIIQKREE